MESGMLRDLLSFCAGFFKKKSKPVCGHYAICYSVPGGFAQESSSFWVECYDPSGFYDTLAAFIQKKHGKEKFTIISLTIFPQQP
jgi:hypothetical protein